METNNHKISDYSAVLAEKYGAVDSPERNQFNEEAYAFYTGQILKEMCIRDRYGNHFLLVFGQLAQIRC